MTSSVRPLVLALALSVVALPALAADPPEGGGDAPAAAADASGEAKVKTTALALAHPDLTESRMVQVMRALEGALKKNPRLEMKDLDTRLAEFAQEQPTDEIEGARTAYKDGQQALLELRIPDAVAKLEEAVAGLAKVLPHIKKQELADAMASLAVAQYEGGDKKAGHDQFVELLTWRSDYNFDPQKFPPKYAGMFDEAQRQVEKAKRGAIVISSTPPGAQAYVDGKFIGVTPCTADGQPMGKHFVTLKKEGFKKAVAAVVVQKKADNRAAVTLEQSQKYLLVEQARSKVDASIGQDLIDPEAENLKTVLFLDHAVFVRAASWGDRIKVEAWLYDLRNRHKLSQVHQLVDPAALDKEAATLAASLYNNVNYEGDLAAPVDDGPPKAAAVPVYKKWWFWTIVGGVVVAGAAAGAGYAIWSTRDPGCPDGSSCIHFGF